jgi:MFS family permease
MSLFIEYIREFGRFQRNARLYLLSNALSGVTTGILLVLYNLYLASLGYRTDFIGLVLFIGTLGAGLAIFPAGYCIDRYGGKLILIWSNLAVGIAGAGQILFRQPLPLLATAFVVGVATAFQLVVNAPYLAQNSTEQERPHLFSFNIVVSLGTTVLGEVLGGALPLWFRALPVLMAPLPPSIHWLLAAQTLPRSYQLALLSAGLLAGPSLVPLFLLSDDRPSHASGAVPTSMTATSLAPTSDITTCREPPCESQAPGFTPRLVSWAQQGWLALTKWWKTTRTMNIRSVLMSAFFVLTLVQGLVGLGAGLFIPYFNLYFVEHLHASSALFGLIDGAANGINALLTLLAPWLAQRIGKIPTVALTRLLSIPLLLIIGLTSFLPLAALLYLFRQGAMDMANGIFQVYSMEAVPEQRRGLANSTYQAVFQGAETVTTPLGGVMIAHLGYIPVFVAGAACYAISTGILWARFARGGIGK